MEYMEEAFNVNKSINEAKLQLETVFVFLIQ